MAAVPPVRWAFSPLDEELGLRAKVGFTPKVEEGMVRLGTRMPFRAAEQELAFFLGVQVAEATVRQVTEQAGAARVQLQAEEVQALSMQRPQSPAGPGVQLMSLDGALIQLVTGQWKEVKTLALGVVGEAKNQKEGEEKVQTHALSYFSRMSEAEVFQQEALGELYRRGVEKAGIVCAVTDGAEWIQKWVDYHRSDAVRILDFVHAVEYVSKGGQAAFEHLPQEEQALGAQDRFEQWLEKQKQELKTGEAQGVLTELERLRCLMQEQEHKGAIETLDKSLYYLRQRTQMMAYAHFRVQGYPIGSGSVESANKLVVQSRLKGAGMRWEPTHVNPMVAMRNLACNDCWKEGWGDIRHHWQQQQRLARQRRSLARLAALACSAPLAEPDLSVPPTQTAPDPPTPSSHPEPSQPPALSVLPRGSRLAGTHPWQRDFLRRRSA